MIIKFLLEIVKKMNRKSMKYVDSIDTSHDVVAYLMVTMNCEYAKKLEKSKVRCISLCQT